MEGARYPAASGQLGLAVLSAPFGGAARWTGGFRAAVRRSGRLEPHPYQTYLPLFLLLERRWGNPYVGLMNLLACFIPYIAVLIGMLLCNHAWLAIGLYHAGIVAFLFYRRPAGLVAKIRAGFYLPLLIPGVCICALAAPVLVYLWPWLSRPDVPLLDWLSRFGLQGAAWILFIPYFAIVHPILEELHWRTLTTGEYRLFRWQDAAFAGYHLLVLGSLVQTLWLLLVFGVLVCSSSFWRWAAMRFGGYGITIVTHAVADASVLAGVLWLTQ